MTPRTAEIGKPAAVQACKKRKSEAGSVLNAHLEIEEDKLGTADSSDTGGKSGFGTKAQIRVIRTQRREKMKTQKRMMRMNCIWSI